MYFLLLQFMMERSKNAKHCCESTLYFKINSSLCDEFCGLPLKDTLAKYYIFHKNCHSCSYKHVERKVVCNKRFDVKV